MIVGIAVDTTVDSKEASAVTRTSATVTIRRRLGSKRGIAMERESIECRHARPRRDERLQLQGVEGKLLPRRSSRRPDARVLRRAASDRRDQQHLLQHAKAGA